MMYKSKPLSPFALPFCPSRDSSPPQPQLKLLLPPPPPPPPPFQPWLPTQPWVNPPVRCFSFLRFHYHVPFYRSPPSLLPSPTYLYSFTTTSGAAAADLTTAKDASEVVVEEAESGFEVLKARKNEGGLEVMEAKKDKVNGFKNMGFPAALKGFRRGFLGGRKRRQKLMPRFVPRSNNNNPSPLLPQNRKSSHFHGLDRSLTSVMIRHIPNKLREMLIKLLDEHCAEENAKMGLGSNCGLLISAYDFVYVPFDFSSGVNKGYAFVNFTSKAAADRFKTSYDGHKWPMFSSKKICKFDNAKIQGREGLVQRFQNMKFPCDKEQYLPVQFTPPRNGSSQCPPPSTVGSLLDRRRNTP